MIYSGFILYAPNLHIYQYNYDYDCLNITKKRGILVYYIQDYIFNDFRENKKTLFSLRSYKVLIDNEGVSYKAEGSLVKSIQTTCALSHFQIIPKWIIQMNCFFPLAHYVISTIKLSKSWLPFCSLLEYQYKSSPMLTWELKTFRLFKLRINIKNNFSYQLTGR